MVIEKGEETKTVRTEELSAKVKELLIRQLTHELRNHNLYMTFSNFYANKGLNLLAEYYKLRAEEEYTHHNWIRTYLSDNGINYKYPAVEEINENFSELIDPIKLTVKVEEETTSMIYDIVDQAVEEGDHITAAWLNTPGLLVLEQLEEQSLSTAVLDIASMNDGWLMKEKAIMALYKQ